MPNGEVGQDTVSTLGVEQIITVVFVTFNGKWWHFVMQCALFQRKNVSCKEKVISLPRHIHTHKFIGRKSNKEDNADLFTHYFGALLFHV